MDKRVMLVVAVLVMVGIGWGVASCGGDEDQNECQEHAEFMLDATIDACEDQQLEDCCFCQCAMSGESSQEGCVCDTQGAPSGQFDGECEGADVDRADRCLSNTASCRDQQAIFVRARCP
jgi:hypothetical protein